MATPLDALGFREIFGRTIRREERGYHQAFQVAPITDTMTSREVDAMVEQVRRSLVRCVDYGEVHYVGREMVGIINDVIRDHMQGERLFHLDQGDLPSLTGFVYFDREIQIPTIYSPTGYQNLRGILWDQYAIAYDEDAKTAYAYHGGAEEEHKTRTPEVVGKILYSVCDTPNEKQRDLFGRWKMRHWVPAPWGERLTPEMINRELVDNVKEAVQHDSRFRDISLTPDELEQDYQDGITALDTLFKVLTVWMAMIQQEIPVKHPRPSSYDKVMHKEGRPPADVKVTYLRRYEHTPPTGMAEVDWAYRWEVKGHYRWQRVGPKREFVRRVWVKQHVKGPPDKPLVRRDSVTALVR